jgi:hypothetical protein
VGRDRGAARQAQADARSRDHAEIRERKLAPGLKGKTPEQTVAAQLAVAVKRGLYVERAAPGKFWLKSERSERGANLTAKPKR